MKAEALIWPVPISNRNTLEEPKEVEYILRRLSYS